MIFGYDKYTILEDGLAEGSVFPLPNGRVDAESLPKHFSVLSKFDTYSSLFNKDINFKGYGFSHDLVDNLIAENKKFIYPILIRDIAELHLLSNKEYYLFSNNLIQAVKNQNAVILLAYLFEGDFYPESTNTVSGINTFADTYGLEKQHILVLNNNILLNYYSPENAKFTAKAFNYFLMSPWFLPSQFFDDNFCRVAKDSFSRRLEQYCTYPKAYKFLSFNRRPRPHRIALFTEIKKNKELSKNTLISLGNRDMDSNYVKTKMSFIDVYNNLIDPAFKYNKETGIEFLNDYNEDKEAVIDTGLQYNHALTINETLHTSTFVNLLTETLYDNNTIFFSEKIWKPIYAGQPFIVLGNPGLLKELRRLGFKTFSEFWDESYDTELDFTKRLEKILDVVNFINNLSDTEINDISSKMHDILKHNFFNYLEKSKGELYKLKQLLNESLN